MELDLTTELIQKYAGAVDGAAACSLGTTDQFRAHRDEGRVYHEQGRATRAGASGFTSGVRNAAAVAFTSLSK